MRSLEVCRKCKLFEREAVGNRLLVSCSLDGAFWDWDYDDEYVQEEPHSDCPYKMEQIVMLAGKKK